MSVDDICTTAGVKKGSFYYFFPSKAALAVAAFEEHWQCQRPQLDQIFSPLSDPLERLENYCRMLCEVQREKRELTGHVLGCPYASVGAELSAQDEKIRLKVYEMFERTCKYLETTFRDAHSQGLIPAQDFAAAARAACSHIIGTLMHARIKNDLEVLVDLHPNLLRLVQAEAVAVL